MKARDLFESVMLEESYRELKPAFDKYRTFIPSDVTNKAFALKTYNDNSAMERRIRKFGYVHPVDAFEYLVKHNLLETPHTELKNTYSWIKNFSLDGLFAISGFLVLIELSFEAIEKRKKQKELGKDYKTIYKSGTLFITQPMTKEASQRLGAGTKWCTTSACGSMFSSYKDNGNLYYLEIKGPKSPFNKMAVYDAGIGHPEIYDAADEGVHNVALILAILAAGENPKKVFNMLNLHWDIDGDEDDIEWYASRIGIKPPSWLFESCDSDVLEESEKNMTEKQKKRREEIVLAMKKNKSYLKKKYGDRWEEVMYATATKKAMEETDDEDS